MRKRIRASPFPSGLAVLLWPTRVHFRCRLSGSIRCSPPRLAATQLLQVLTRNTVPNGRGLPPRRIVTLHSALGRCVSTAPVIGERKDRCRSRAKHNHASSLSRLNLRLTADSSPYLVRIHFFGHINPKLHPLPYCPSKICIAPMPYSVVVFSHESPTHCKSGPWPFGDDRHGAAGRKAAVKVLSAR